MSPDHEYPYDAIVLLCGGVSKDRALRKWGLNFESSFKAKAAAIAYQRGLAPWIISSGGPMWGAPPLGDLMADYLTSNLLGGKYRVPEKVLLRETTCTDSGEQMKNIANIAQEKGFVRLGIVGDSVHLRVAVPVMKNLGLDAKPLVMEDLLVLENPRYKRVVDKLHSSLYWKWWSFKYSRLEKTLAKDPTLKSPIGRAIMRFQRTKLPWLRLPGTT